MFSLSLSLSLSLSSTTKWQETKGGGVQNVPCDRFSSQQVLFFSNEGNRTASTVKRYSSTSQLYDIWHNIIYLMYDIWHNIIYLMYDIWHNIIYLMCITFEIHHF